VATAKTLLITGATGFLGSHLVRRFLTDGWNVAILKRPASNLNRIADILDSLLVFDVDCLNELFTLGHVDTVIHTATNYGRFSEPASSIFQANTAFPLRLLEALTRQGTGTLINTDTVLDPMLNPYALSKHQFKQWGQQFARDGGLRFINLRLEHIYGAGDDPTKFTTNVIRSCLDNVPQLKLTLGEQKRDFIHVNDAVNAYATVLDRLLELGPGFNELDVGSGRAVTIREFVETVRYLTKANTQLEFGALPYRPNETMFSHANTAHLAALGWTNLYDLPAGLAQTIESEQSSAASINKNRYSA
jgi:CDP-paratose synthetase